MANNAAPKNSQRIKIVSCKDPLLWYASHVGEIFNLVRIEQGSKEHYWTREKDPPHYLNWVAEKDAVLVKDENAMLQMVEYREQDVNLLHEVYLKLRAVGNAANFNAGLYYKDDEPTMRCPTCGSSNVATTGRAITTTLSVFDEYLCQDCGSIHRNRQTKTTKEDRSALLSAVK